MSQRLEPLPPGRRPLSGSTGGVGANDGVLKRKRHAEE
jgi:hypothetical protein